MALVLEPRPDHVVPVSAHGPGEARECEGWPKNKGFNLQTNGNGGNRVGTCSGDSIGPVFLGDATSNVIVGVTSFGLNEWCRGTDFAYRVDTQDVQDWISGILED